MTRLGSSPQLGENLAFGAVLRRLRIAACLSQETLAERSSVSPETVGALERGARKTPHRDTVSLLCQGLALSNIDGAELEAAAANSRRCGVPRLARTIERVGVPNNLPHPLTSFIGRESELARLRTLLRERRLITLHGPGGSGKTRLALELCRSLVTGDEFPDGIWSVDLASASVASHVAASVARSVRVRERPDEPLEELLVRELGDRRALLVFDNCEHLVDECARLAEALVRRCRALRILSTSREALQISGEAVFPIDALLVPPDADAHSKCSLTRLREYASVVLLLERAEDADPQRFADSAARDPESIAQICRRLDGLPLALEIAAARAADLSPREIASALASHSGFLITGSRTAPPRHRTMRGLLDWSYALLDASQAALFRGVGIFAGTWTAEAARAVCGDESDPIAFGNDIAKLVAKSLVSVASRHGPCVRYRLLASTREYAQALIGANGDRARLSSRRATYFSDRARNYASLETICEERDDIAAALDWAITEGNAVTLGIELTAALTTMWVACDADVERSRRIDAAYAALQADGRLQPTPFDRARSDVASDMPDAWLAAFQTPRTYERGSILFRKGDAADSLLYVVAGNVDLPEVGRTIGPGELLGDVAFFSPTHRRSASAVCETSAEIRSLDIGTTLELYENDFAFRRYLIRLFATRLLADLVRREKSPTLARNE